MVDYNKVRRRALLRASGGAAVVGLAGCLGGDGGDGGDGGGGDGGDGGDGDGDDTTETETETEQPDTSGGTYTIGMADSLTGSLAAFGERNQRGKELALADVNEVGVKDGELELIVEDTQSQPQNGVSAAQKLVNQDGVPLLIGAVSSGVSIAIHESVVQGTDVVQISQNSTSPKLTDFPNLLRMSPPGRAQSAGLAKVVSDNGHESVAISWINNDYGEGISEAFANSFTEDFGGEIVYNKPHDQGKATYSGTVTEMENAGADAWVFVTYQPEFTTMSQEAFDLGYADGSKWYGADSVKGPKVLESLPEGAIDGLTLVAPATPENQENYQNFAARFEDEFGDEPTAWSAYAYDAIVTAALSIQAANEFTGAALGDVVRDVTRPDGEKAYTYADAQKILAEGGSPSDVDYQGVSGPIDIDENGDPVAFLKVVQVQNHEFVDTGTVAE